MSPQGIEVSGGFPLCGRAVVVRRRGRDGTRFVSCSGYPAGEWSLDYDDALAALARQLDELCNQTAAHPVDLSRALREVVTYAHPDHWPAATELADGDCEAAGLTSGIP
jgi:ssDNA-binding Zn-finger/Zn-ribbon topoisomerase 1